MTWRQQVDDLTSKLGRRPEIHELIELAFAIAPKRNFAA